MSAMPEANFRERLIFALDVPDMYDAEKLVEELEDTVEFFKVGIILHTAEGKKAVDYLLKKGKKVFLDLKFFDIGSTVRDAVKCAAGSGVDLLTVHANGEVMKSAVEGRGKEKLKILAVTLLTNLDSSDIEGGKEAVPAEKIVLERAKAAMATGCDGIITSGKEIERIRKATGNKTIIVTPGVRPEGNASDGHKRSVTPFEAISAGADYIVVGRPIKNAPNPREKALSILKEMERAANSLKKDFKTGSL